MRFLLLLLLSGSAVFGALPTTLNPGQFLSTSPLSVKGGALQTNLSGYYTNGARQILGRDGRIDMFWSNNVSVLALDGNRNMIKSPHGDFDAITVWANSTDLFDPSTGSLVAYSSNNVFNAIGFFDYYTNGSRAIQTSPSGVSIFGTNNVSQITLRLDGNAYKDPTGINNGVVIRTNSTDIYDPTNGTLVASASNGVFNVFTSISGNGGGISNLIQNVYLIAASDSPASIKSIASAICTGTGDEGVFSNAVMTLGRKNIKAAEGNYAFSAACPLTNNVFISGPGAIITVASTNVNHFFATNVSNVTMEYLQLTGAGRNYAAASNIFGNGIYAVGVCSNILMRSLTFRDVQYGFICKNQFGTSNVNSAQITMSKCLGNRLSGALACFRAANDVLVENCYLDGARTGFGDAISCEVGLWFADADYLNIYGNGVVCRGNTIKNIHNEAINSTSLKSMIGPNNRCFNAGKGALLEGTASGTDPLEASYSSIFDNTFEQCASGAMVAGESGLATVSPSFCKITGNTITNSTQTGINVYGPLSSQTANCPLGIEVSGNTIVGSATFGILLNASNSIVSGNIIRNTTNDAIRLQWCYNAKLVNNDIKNIQTDGIAFDSSKANIWTLIQGGSILDCGQNGSTTQDGIHIQGNSTNVNIQGVFVSNTGLASGNRYGVNVASGCTNVTVVNCELKKNNTSPYNNSGKNFALFSVIDQHTTGGSDTGSNDAEFTRTQGTEKKWDITMPHQNNEIQGEVSLFYGDNSSVNELYIGGGHSTFNAMQRVHFYAAGSSTTTTGTEMGEIRTGGWRIGAAGASSTMLEVVGGISAATNIAAVLTADNPTNSYIVGTAYTNLAQRTMLVGSAILNGGISGSANITLYYTNNAVAYVLAMQTGAGIATTDIFPFCVPLSTNATFSFVQTMGTGATGVITNVVNWKQ